MDDVSYSHDALKELKFIAQSILLPLLVCTGVPGNIITIIVLTKKRMVCSTSVYLTGLAMAHILYLFTWLVLSLGYQEYTHNRKYELYWRFNALISWVFEAANGSVLWLSVALIVERYVAVCHPSKAKHLCTEGKAKTALVCIGCFFILAAFPNKYEFQLKFEEFCLERCNNTALKEFLARDSITYVPVYDRISLAQANKNLEGATMNLNRSRESLSLTLNFTAHPSVIYVPYYPIGIFKNITFDSNFILTVPVDSYTNKVRKRRGVEKAEEDIASNATETNDTVVAFKNNSSTLVDFNEVISIGNGNFISVEDCCDKTYNVTVEQTKIAKSDAYFIARHIFIAVFYYFSPFIIVGVLDALLILSVYRYQHRDKIIANVQEVSAANDNRVTYMVIAIGIMFMVCQIPGIIYAICFLFLKKEIQYTEDNATMSYIFVNLFATINASCNFLLYFAFSRKFRATFRHIFLERRAKRENTLASLPPRTNSQKFDPNADDDQLIEYRTPRNLETESLPDQPQSEKISKKARMYGLSSLKYTDD